MARSADHNGSEQPPKRKHTRKHKPSKACTAEPCHRPCIPEPAATFASREQLLQTAAEYLAVSYALKSSHDANGEFPSLNLERLAAFRSARSAGPMYIPVSGRQEDESQGGDLHTYKTEQARNPPTQKCLTNVSEDFFVPFENASMAGSMEFELPTHFYDKAESVLTELVQRVEGIPQFNFDHDSESDTACRPSDVFQLADAHDAENRRVSFRVCDLGARDSTKVAYHSPPPRASRIFATFEELTSKMEGCETSRPEPGMRWNVPAILNSPTCDSSEVQGLQYRSSFALTAADTPPESPRIVVEEEISQQISSAPLKYQAYNRVNIMASTDKSEKVRGTHQYLSKQLAELSNSMRAKRRCI